MTANAALRAEFPIYPQKNCDPFIIYCKLFIKAVPAVRSVIWCLEGMVCGDTNSGSLPTRQSTNVRTNAPDLISLVWNTYFGHHQQHFHC